MSRGKAFHGEGLWSFGNEFARDVVIFVVDNSSLSHTYNHKNNFFLPGEGPVNGNNASTGAVEKKLVLKDKILPKSTL